MEDCYIVLFVCALTAILPALIYLTIPQAFNTRLGVDGLQGLFYEWTRLGRR